MSLSIGGETTIVVIVCRLFQFKIIAMGIQGQVSLLFKLKEIGFDYIIYLMKHHHAEQHRFQMTLCAQPKVTLNASLLGYNILGTSLLPANGIYLICAAFSNCNIDVLIICDSPT